MRHRGRSGRQTEFIILCVETCKIVGRRVVEVLGVNGLVMGRGMMLGEVVSLVTTALAPKDVKLTLALRVREVACACWVAISVIAVSNVESTARP